MPPTPHPPDHSLARSVLDAFEREFWAGHHDRARLLAAPLRVLHDALIVGGDCLPTLSGLLQALDPDPPTQG